MEYVCSGRLLSRSSYDLAKYKISWLKAKVIHYYILSAGEFTDACSRSLSVPINYNGIASIMEVTGAILPKQCANEITRHEQKKKYCPMQHLSVIRLNK